MLFLFGSNKLTVKKGIRKRIIIVIIIGSRMVIYIVAIEMIDYQINEWK